MKLASLDFSKLDQLPSFTGIYFVYNSKCLLYIGIAKNLHNRWNHATAKHHRETQLKKLKAYKIEWLEVKDTDRESLLITERVLIKSLQPLLNDTKIVNNDIQNTHVSSSEKDCSISEDTSCDILSPFEKESARYWGMTEIDYAMMTDQV